MFKSDRIATQKCSDSTSNAESLSAYLAQDSLPKFTFWLKRKILDQTLDNQIIIHKS